MSATSITSANSISAEKWHNQLFREYLGQLRYKPLMGMDMASAIVVREDLIKERGDKVNVAFRTSLSGAGVSGTSQLEGNEEQLQFYNQAVEVDLIRNAVRTDGRMSEKRVVFSLREEMGQSLTQWAAHKVERDLAREMASIDGVVYAAASEGQKDSWTANNSDRVLFGAATSNNSSNDHSASLLNIDSSTDVLKPEIISLAKRMAKLASPKIEPIRVVDGIEMYIMTAHPYAFRDLSQNSTITAAQREVFPRMGNDHPLLKGQAWLYWDGVLILEAEKTLLLDNVGAASIDVAVNCLHGAGSILYAQGGVEGQRMLMQEETFDYGNQYGVAMNMCYGVEAAVYNSKLNGQVRVYTSAVAD